MGSSAFSEVTEATLKDTHELSEWFGRESRSSNPIVGESEADRLNVFGAAERAIEIGKRKNRDPVPIFAGIVSKNRWGVISCEQADRAHQRLKAYERSGGRLAEAIRRERRAAGELSVNGNSIHAPRRGSFACITISGLRDTRWLVSWHAQMSRGRYPDVPPGEASLLNVLALAEHSLATGTNPAALFTSIIRRRLCVIVRPKYRLAARYRLQTYRARLARRNALNIEPTVG